MPNAIIKSVNGVPAIVVNGKPLNKFVYRNRLHNDYEYMRQFPKDGHEIMFATLENASKNIIKGFLRWVINSIFFTVIISMSQRNGLKKIRHILSPQIASEMTSISGLKGARIIILTETI